ncbi:MAG: TRAP transporter substrate-binding protein [Rhodospirillaceae bacterium]|nr:TRAP transporter substrate-binding protein [Rhodospirillaceae bacterium]
MMIPAAKAMFRSVMIAMIGFVLVSAAAHAATELVVVGNTPPGGAGDTSWRLFQANLAAKAPGRFDVRMLTHGELGGDDQGFPAIRRGRGQFGIAGESGYAQLLPEASVLALPFLFSSTEETDFVFDNFWTPEAQALAAARGITLIQWVEIGWLSLFGKKPMPTPDDARNTRLRAFPYEASQMFLKQVGADTIVLATPDVLASLQTGLIDGGEFSLLSYLRFGIWEQAPHLTLTQHSYAVSGLFANTAFLDRLSPADRAALTTAFPDPATNRRDTRADLVRELDDGVTKGVIVHNLTAEQRALWERQAQPMHRAVLDRLGPDAARIYDLVMDGKRAYAARAVE